ncbi:MAG: biotin/lipoyl-binding protein [Chloroflexi bacterium]|nr:biotin/lipoyl-binding protein [Chloroflexota bacterium]
MKLLKIMLLTLLLGSLAVSLAGCGSKPASSSVPGNQVVAVQRGNLTLDITAAGNLALSRTEDLPFGIAGTVEAVLVEEGDSVEQGKVLARLDTSEWEEQVKALEEQLIAAKRNLTTKERAVTTAERNLAAKERAVTTAERTLLAKERVVIAKELALRQEQIDLQTAEYNLSQIDDVKKAQDDIDDAEYDLRIAQAMWKRAVKSGASEDELDYWREQIISAKARLATAQEGLKEIFADSSVRVTTEVAIEVATKQLAVEQAQKAIDDAQMAVEDAQIAVEDARIAIDDARKDVEDARTDAEDGRVAAEDAAKDVEDAQEALDEVLSTSLEIVAPFDGFITTVNVKGGDEVKKGTVAAVIADPDKFEADILVSEMDILQIRLGGEARVQVDAMSGLSLPAKVTHISPTANIQQGVVNYKVKVEVQSPEAVIQERQQARQDVSSGALPERIKQAIEEGRITQEQAEEMMKQRQGGQSVPVPTTAAEGFQLREGLTVTVSVITAQRSNALLIPNAAVTRRGMASYVKVSKDGVIEEREIKTGISNWQYTEVTEGLSEGEAVVVPQQVTTTSGAQQQRQPSGGMFVPGMGRVR